MKILLIDGFSILNRAYYALPPMKTKSGEYTNAILGFLNIFYRFLDEEKPDFVTVAFDLPVPTFRHEIFGAYKGTRKSMPDELRVQVPLIKDLLKKMGIHLAEAPGFEADDIIGTLAKKAEEQRIKPVVLSGDRDLLQLATEVTKIRIPKTKGGKTEVEDYYAADVLEKNGVTPLAYIDVKALMGDASDNIPGVPGIGEVTATKIIKEYGSIENAIENASEIKPKKASENLTEFKEQAILSKKLATIILDVPVELECTQLSNLNSSEAFEEIKRLELKSLYKKFESQKNEYVEEASVFNCEIIEDISLITASIYRLISSKNPASFFTLWDNEKKQVIGISIAEYCDNTLPFYLPIKSDETISLIKKWLESDSEKYVFDLKNEMKQLKSYNIKLTGKIFDAMLGAYVLDPLRLNNHIGDIAINFLNENVKSLDDILDNKGKRTKDRQAVSNLPVDIAGSFAAKASEIILKAKIIMEKEIEKSNQQKLFYEIEMPLASKLAEMESTGVKVCRDFLTDFGKQMDIKIAGLTSSIYELAEEEFNINSPQQLGVILFEKLGLAGGKKTKTGYSTAADVLEKLRKKHPIVSMILEYRTFAKLKSTYVEGLLPLINEKTGRVYTTFQQALTATGRLSSTEPNLQNIPIRLPLGRELRKAFVPDEGMVFVDADYSQIELRLLAHISQDEVLINAFKNGDDIHTLTASQVLGINPEEVSKEERSNAKAVNFGIVYGISAFGLSEDIGVTVKEAERYINGYFEKYPGVKAYLDDVVKQARKDGFVSTVFNRRRSLSELSSSNYNMRSFGERVAMNMPLQGTAADIMKIAMINVANRLEKEGLKAKIILQVHDELLVESPVDEAEKVKLLLKEEMEQAANLSVPLTVDVSVGDSWYDTK